MGLAGRKTKQRIGADPRNLTWSDDSAKFGAKYLQSLGWTSGTGLGVSGEGRTSNLKIHQKLDLMGIGANRRGPDGDDAGWRGGREFEGLLARLNQAQNADTQDIPVDEEHVADNNDPTVDDRTRRGKSAVRKRSLEVNDHPPEPSTNREADPEHKKKRKRCTAEDEEVDAKEAKRRRKEEKREKKEQKEAEKAAKKLKASQKTQSVPSDQAVVATADDVREQNAEAVKVTPRYRAHRARNIASKRLAAVSATGMNEILGISSSTSLAPKTEISSIPFPKLNALPQKHLVQGEDQTRAPGFGLFPVNDHLEQAVETDGTNISTMGLGSHSALSRGLGFRSESETATPKNDGNDLLRKSGKSVAEYFAEKMRMKSRAKDTPTINEAENPQRKNGKKKLESIYS